MKIDFQTSRAFSLIESLTVMGILAILATLLLAALVKAKGDSKRTACMSNVKQLTLGMLAFAHDNDEILPSTNDVQAVYWQFMGAHVDLTRPLWDTAAKLFHCPAGTRRMRVNSSPWWTNSYDFNGWNKAAGMSGNSPSIAGKSISSIKSVDKAVLIAEHTAFVAQSWHPARSDSHVNALNVVGFLDGHVGWVRIYWNGKAGIANYPFNYDPPPSYQYSWSGN